MKLWASSRSATSVTVRLSSGRSLPFLLFKRLFFVAFVLFAVKIFVWRRPFI
jgi:hypothetical protein